MNFGTMKRDVGVVGDTYDQVSGDGATVADGGFEPTSSLFSSAHSLVKTCPKVRPACLSTPQPASVGFSRAAVGS